MGNNSKSKITPYLYLVPCMLIFGVFLFYPFVQNKQNGPGKTVRWPGQL